MSFSIKGVFMAFITCFFIHCASAATKSAFKNGGNLPAPSFQQLPFGTSVEGNTEVAKAAAAVEEVEVHGRFTDNLSTTDLNVLPIGLKFNEGGSNNTKVTIAVSSVVFTPSYAELNVYAKVTIPQKPGKLFFGAKGIKLSYTGGIIGDGKLVLLNDVKIPINGENAALILRGSDNGRIGTDLSYLSMDCKGFRELGITADVQLNKGLFLPLDANGNIIEDPNATVTGSFSTVVKDWNDIIASISLPSFAIKGLDGFSFNVQNAVFDFSDLHNSPDIRYPRDYEAKYLTQGMENLWRGIFIQNLTVVLPPMFKKKSSGPVSFSASDMLIDDHGVSGLFEGADILPISQGNASGWAFSVNHFSLELEANALKAAGFSGELALPVMKEKALGYKAFISSEGEYLLQVANTDSLAFDLWQAKVALAPNSYVEFKVVDKQFRPAANLNGSLSFGTKLAKVKDVVFQNLHLQTQEPYMSVDYLGYTGEASLKGFPVSIEDIGLSLNARQAALSFKLNVELQSKQIKASTTLSIRSSVENSEGLQHWSYSGTNVNDIFIDTDIAEVLKLKGSIRVMDNDPVYGDGFQGNLSMGLPLLKIGNVSASVVFGKKEFRYWLVDALVDFGGGIPVIGPFKINGIGGGAYYSMSKTSGRSSFAPTGTQYRPDEKSGLGIRMAVLYNLGTKNIANGSATFEVAFNKNWGINYVGFFGNATFMASIPGAGSVSTFLGDKFAQVQDKLREVTEADPAVRNAMEKLKVGDPSKAAEQFYMGGDMLGQASLSASVGIQYNFDNKTFDAKYDLFMNAAGGLLRGAASQNRAGWGVLHISPEEWYMHMGRPDDRLGVVFGVGSFSIKTGAYLMVGDKIPGSPPPPREVADILGKDLSSLDYMRDLNALGDGKGMAFGANIAVSTGDITVLIVYANFKAGLGFDLMLKDYGDAHCAGKSGPIGIDGWYANGQAYAYLQGEVGVKVHLLFVKARIPILKGAAAALLQAKLPNPSWFRGYLAVQFDVMGGLVKGRARLKISIGDECEIVGMNTNPAGVNIIADLSPKVGEPAVDVFAAPQATFNMKVGTPFDVDDDEGRKTFRIKLEKFEVLDKGVPVKGKLSWNSGLDAVSFYSLDVLPPQASLKASVKVSFEQLKGGIWQAVYVDGKKTEEMKEVDFTTGSAPTTVPLSNIAYCYPVAEQKNFYRGESRSAYIRLKRGQFYLFDGQQKQEIRISSSSQSFALPFSYDRDACELRFNMRDVALGSSFNLDVVTIPEASAAGDGNLSYQQIASGDENSIEVRNKQAIAAERSDLLKKLLSYSFSTSRYETFYQKMAAASFKRSNINRITSDVISLETTVADYEPFDLTELRGTSYTSDVPLVQPSAMLNEEYYTGLIYPLLYKDYPQFDDIRISNRDVSEYGLEPRKALPIINRYIASIEQGINTGVVRNILPYLYNLPQVYKNDFLDLQNQVANKSLYSAGRRSYSRLLTEPFPFIKYGSYRVIYRYIMPDGKEGSSSTVEYFNEIK